MLSDEIQECVHAAKQRAWDEMSSEERNLQHLQGMHSPDMEKAQIKSNNRGNLLVAGYILAILIFSIFF